MEHYVYALIDQNGQPFYIGKTKNPRRRKARHLYDATKLHYNWPVHNKIRKLLREGLGIDIEVIESNLAEDDIDEREQFWIAHYRQKGAKIYNVADGGEGGKGTTAETIEKIRKANMGHTCSEETRQKISAATKGRVFTKEHRKKLSQARRKRTITQETRAKTSNTSRGRINIKVYEVISPEGSTHLTTTGLKDFCRQQNLTPGNMLKVLKGERDHHKGWRIRECQQLDEGQFPS